MPKVAIILGAGASASEGAPVQNNIFREYFKICRLHGYRQQRMDTKLAQFFRKMFDIDVINSDLDSIEFPTFEEALGILDLADLRNESFKDFSNLNTSSNSGKLKYLRLYLTLLLAKTLHEKLFVSNQIHHLLVENLQNSNLLFRVFFISTNYDILIDNALSNLYPSYSLDYGIDFINYNEPDNWTRPHNHTMRLFKIHGSLNWLYCPTCNNIRLTPKEKGVIKLISDNFHDLRNSYCKICQTTYSPIIIPPTFYKNFSNPYLNLVWIKAEQELLKASHIIFCGYSFPDADMHIKYLIKRVQKNRSERLPRFSVVNNHSGKSESIKDEEGKRFSRFLGSRVNYTNYSFEEFAKDPTLLISH